MIGTGGVGAPFFPQEAVSAISMRVARIFLIGRQGAFCHGSGGRCHFRVGPAVERKNNSSNNFAGSAPRGNCFAPPAQPDPSLTLGMTSSLWPNIPMFGRGQRKTTATSLHSRSDELLRATRPTRSLAHARDDKRFCCRASARARDDMARRNRRQRCCNED